MLPATAAISGELLQHRRGRTCPGRRPAPQFSAAAGDDVKPARRALSPAGVVRSWLRL